MAATPPHHNPAFPYAQPSIFATMSGLAAKHGGAINLGQGFPEEDGPDAVKAAAADALTSTPQQYAHPAGLPALRAALATHEAAFFGTGTSALDPDTQVLVTAGATEALAATILGLASPGKEVVLIDPAYDSYAPLIRCAGGTPVPIRLVPPPPPGDGGDSTTAATPAGTAPSTTWSLPTNEALSAAFRPGKTVALILNTPHNPTGHVFSAAELTALAEQVRRCDGCIAICDEVYESLALPPHAHASLAALPGMADRCVRIGSAGKTFSLTGWKVGWVTAANSSLVAAVAGAHQFLTFSVPGALQAGVAHGLTHCRGFIDRLGTDLAAKRDRLAPALAAVGFRVLPSEATYFLTADAASLMRAGEDDVAFCERLVAECGVAAIPLSPFYTGPDPPTRLVRFCFAKKDGTLDAAAARLAAYFKAL
jgi:N-succinyldiaminopimelate aminotransferase